MRDDLTASRGGPYAPSRIDAERPHHGANNIEAHSPAATWCSWLRRDIRSAAGMRARPGGVLNIDIAEYGAAIRIKALTTVVAKNPASRP